MKKAWWKSDAAFVLGVMAIVTVLYAQIFTSPYTLEEYRQLCTLEGDAPAAMSRWQLWRWRTFAPGEHARDVASGWTPWWENDSGGYMAFFRPLSSAVFVLEHAIFGRNLVISRVHSLLWFAALIFLFYTLLKRAFPLSTARVSVLVFAISSVNEEPILELCARHILISATFGLSALLAYLDWRERGGLRRLLFALLSMLLSSFGGEASLQVLVYALAYELLGDNGPRRTRIWATSGVLAYGATYSVLHKAFGFGASFGDPTGGYLSVSVKDLSWVPHALKRIPWAVEVLLFEREWWIPSTGVIGTCAAACLLAFAYVSRRAAPEGFGSRLGRAFFFGGVLAVALGLVGVRTARTLFVPAMSASAALGLLIEAPWRANDAVPSRIWRYVARGLSAVVTVAMLANASAIPTDLAAYRSEQGAMTDIALKVHADIAASGVSKGDVFLIPTSAEMRYQWPVRCVVPRARRNYSTWILHDTTCSFTLRRVDGHTLELELVDQCPELEGVREAMEKGEPRERGAETSAMSVRMTEWGKRVTYTFVRPVDDPDLNIFVPQGGSLKQIVKPGVGESLLVTPDAPAETTNDH